MIDYLFESSNITGTYSALLLSEDSREALYSFCAKLGISNLVPAEDYHCTLIYSRNPCHEVVNEDFNLPCGGIPIGYKILGVEKKVLVIELMCPNAANLHEKFVSEYGATHDYETYIPHITISGEYDGDLPVDIPEMIIEFTGLIVEDLSK